MYVCMFFVCIKQSLHFREYTYIHRRLSKLDGGGVVDVCMHACMLWVCTKQSLRFREYTYIHRRLNKQDVLQEKAQCRETQTHSGPISFLF
jgi:hypothetical protein